jgi:predicted transporter
MMSWLLAALVGAVFLFAGVQKAMSWSMWRSDASSQGVPFVVAMSVPAIEVALGVALITLPPTGEVLMSSLVVLCAFTVHLARRIHLRDEVPCGCFGSRRRRPPRWRDVWRNAGLMTCLVLSLIL